MKNREYYINLLKVEQMMSDDNYQYLEELKAVERLRMEQQFYQLFLIQSQLLEKLNF